MPRICGGMNLQYFETWNKAALIKYLWSIARGKERLWIKWVHTYFIKGRGIECPILKCVGWMTKKIIESRKYIQQWGTWVEVECHGEFSIRKAYWKLLGQKEKPKWRGLICNIKAAPKCIFMVWMMTKQRLYTMDRLAKWGIDVELQC